MQITLLGSFLHTHPTSAPIRPKHDGGPKSKVTFICFQVCYSIVMNMLMTEARKIEFLRTAVICACWSLFISGNSVTIPVPLRAWSCVDVCSAFRYSQTMEKLKQYTLRASDRGRGASTRQCYFSHSCMHMRGAAQYWPPPTSPCLGL